MEVTRIAGQEEKQIKNVAAYARVSTLQEEQELSSVLLQSTSNLLTHIE